MLISTQGTLYDRLFSLFMLYSGLGSFPVLRFSRLHSYACIAVAICCASHTCIASHIPILGIEMVVFDPSNPTKKPFQCLMGNSTALRDLVPLAGLGDKPK